MAHVLSVGFKIPGDEIVNISFKSDRSLLDADVILFSPDPESYEALDQYNGKHTLTDGDSARFSRDVVHWRNELTIALEEGKTVFLFMSECPDVYVATGENQYSGTGRNRSVMRLVRLLDPYSSVPIPDLPSTIVRKYGLRISTTERIGVLASYWNEFGPFSFYQAYLNHPAGIPALITQTGNKMVGGIFRAPNWKGTLVILPVPDFDEMIRDRIEQIADRAAQNPNTDPKGKAVAKKEAEESVGGQFLFQIVEIDKTLRSNSARLQLQNGLTPQRIP